MQDHRVGNGAIASTAECFERHKTTSQWDLTQIKKEDNSNFNNSASRIALMFTS